MLLRAMVALSLLAAGGAGAKTAGAVEGRSLFDYKHTRWTVEQGAPSNIQAIAQTADGFLWLATTSGLYRFDGLRFDPVAMRADDGPLSNQVSALLTLRSDALLLGFSDGGLAVFKGGRFTRLRTPLPPDTVRALAQDADGGIWVAHTGAGSGLAYLHHGRWREFGPKDGLPADWGLGVWATRDGAVVVRSRAGLFVRPAGTDRFVQKRATDSAVFAAGRGGRKWLVTKTAVAEIAELDVMRPVAADIALPLGRLGIDVMADADDNLWIDTWSKGLIRVRTAGPPLVETMQAAHGLSSDVAMSALQDREGNIWVGTMNGLDQFRSASIITERRIPETADGLMIGAGAGGQVLLTDFKAMYRAQPGGGLVRDALPAGGVEVACAGTDGSVMLGAGSAFWRLSGGRLTALPAPPPHAGRHLYQCATDRAGATWFAAMDDGVLRWTGRGWRHYPLPRALSRHWAALLTIGRDGSPLVYLNAGPLVRLADGGATRTVWTTESGRIGKLTSLYQAPGYLLLGGARGLGRVRNGVRQSLSNLHHPWLSSVVGMTQTARGDSWLLTAAGLARVRTDALDRAFDRPAARLPVRLFGYADGLPGPADSWGKGNLVEGGDGRIWVITSNRAAWLDPARLPVNRTAPSVLITGFAVDGKSVARRDGLDLGTGRHDVAFRFTAPSLTVPERVRFRYRLDGLDDDWRDAGGMRAALYPRLGPGRYRFRVIAANNDGVWNATGTSIGFVVAPTFFQTRWFPVLIGVLLAMLAYGAAVWRGRQVLARERGIRTERERIARELHDTLLQSVQGLILRFHALALAMPADRPERGQIEGALTRADDVLLEGRERVHNLRAQATPYELSAAIRETAQAQLAGEIAYTFETSGEPGSTDPRVGLEIQQIASEALFNIVKHARARHVAIDLAYERDIVTLRIADDGVGLARATPDRDDPGLHFGLKGMQERADRIGARLRVAEGEAGGVVVCLTIRRTRLRRLVRGTGRRPR